MNEHYKEYDLNHEFRLLEVENGIEEIKIIQVKDILNDYFEKKLIKGVSYDVNKFDTPEKIHNLVIEKITDEKIYLFFNKFTNITYDEGMMRKIKAPIEFGFIRIPEDFEDLK